MKKFKKFIWVLILVILIGVLIYAIINSSSTKTIQNEGADVATRANIPQEENRGGSIKDTTKLVVGDDYFITQINDIYYNQDEYVGREIEIEGFPLSTEEYDFVGRYGPRLLCWRWVCVYRVSI